MIRRVAAFLVIVSLFLASCNSSSPEQSNPIKQKEPTQTARQVTAPTPVLAPSAWQADRLLLGAPATVRSLRLIDGILYAGTPDGLFSFDGHSWKKWRETAKFGLVNDITRCDDTICIATDGLNNPEKITGVHQFMGVDELGLPNWVTKVKETGFSFSYRTRTDGGTSLVAATFGGIYEQSAGVWTLLYDYSIGGQGRFHTFFQLGNAEQNTLLDCMGSLDKGVFCIDAFHPDLLYNLHEDAAGIERMTSNKVRFSHQTTESMLIATEGGGITILQSQPVDGTNRIRPVVFGKLEINGGEEVSWLVTDPNGWLLQASFDKGTRRKVGPDWREVDPSPANTVLVLGEKEGKQFLVLIGTREDGFRVVMVPGNPD